MAITATFTNGDITYDNAYLRVSLCKCVKSYGEYEVEVYSSEESRLNNDEPVCTLVFDFTYDTDSTDGIMQQAYTDLKTHDVYITNPQDV